MKWRGLVVVLLAAAVVAGKGKKHRHHKPGRALLDRLASTTVGAVTVSSGAEDSLPAPLDVAPFSAIVANATCGVDGAEEYCRDMPGKRGVVCDFCEGPEGSSPRQHPASHTVDGDPGTWWQSPSMATGDYSHVDLVATLPDKMELLHVIIKAGPSPRPLAWSLEVSPSETGDDWRLLRAFGDREHCRRLWDLRPERRRRRVRAARSRGARGEGMTCSTQFVSPRPLENGEMHVGVGEGVWARRVRISFRGAHALPPKQQYYTVRALTLAARCLCHGHAASCTVTSQGTKCSCTHGTCGAHCQRCCSGAPWTAHSTRPCGVGDDGACSCGDRGACSYDDAGVILCVNCTENRAGPLCDRCLPGYYSVLPDGPCLPCTCDNQGSDGTCTWNKQHHEPWCTCRDSFMGALCDACVDPLASYPFCQELPTTPSCACDPRGVRDHRLCDNVCECKSNVMGERCDACAPGYFGLSASLADGCRKCYCSHMSESCAGAGDDAAEIEEIAPMPLPLSEGWLVTDGRGNETLEPALDDQGRLYIISYEVEGWESFYWLTRLFVGQQLALYGSELRARMFWGIVRGDTGGSPTVAPDLLLVAADGTTLFFGNRSHDTPGELELVVPLVEGVWYDAGEDPPALASRAQLMDVLRDLREIKLRAHFHGDQDEVRVEHVSVRGAPSHLHETCLCPAGYAGAHCESCAWTHARLALPGAGGARAECVPCDCNGHASCHTVNGPCGSCQHNTTGPHCERCLPGHYGNPVQGACQPCACPLLAPGNNFSPNCALADAHGDDFVCTQCPDGYAGEHCEHCDFGYWGSPTTPGSSCRPCDCGGSPCHPDSGLCVTCPQHTEGARCDQCQEGYWFGAGGWSGAACESCACGAGALSAACDARSGQCACREGWAGQRCDVCAEGHGGVDEGCPLCRCGVGASGGACDAVTGSCTCAPGAAPPACDLCLPEHYGLDDTGCTGCNCSALGAESNACDIRTGQCRCKPHVTGRACDTCEEGYWGLQLGGCRRCSCGAGAAACEPDTGACACAPGVGGARCDRCLPGYYGFGPAGCLPCPECSDGKVCSPESGRCVCPARSRGPGCRQCAPGYWATGGGCQPCRCGAGAASSTCDARTGECRCRAGWTGAECGACAPGHFGPRCRPCQCLPAGTRDCDNGTCACDHQGRCPCKENVVGDKCDQCLDGTFGLSQDNPTGCTACFCFGRSAHCTQASLTRAALHAAAPAHLTLLMGDSVTEMEQESLLAIHTHSPDVTITLPQPPVPVYVALDHRFLGDRVTSYGGALRFRVEEEGGQELPPETRARFPLVRLFGTKIELDYHERIPAVNGTHVVRLHESLWSVRMRGAGAGGVVASRAALMLALRRVEGIMLRVTTRAPTQHDRVHALLLNVSLDTAIPGLSRAAPALGVERCACPRGYSADSCQRPAPGFWIPPQQVHYSAAAGTIIIQMEGDAQPCRCNGRAVACHPDTGHCLNCTGGTGGPQCASCAEGYHGAPDAPGGCQACPCPSRARNFASACVVTAGRPHCLCKPGYTGAECESCASGWYRAPGGECASCACDERGAASAHCDARGRCQCRAHAQGDKCDQCAQTRTFLDHNGCTACDNCTQTLLDSVEALTSDLRTRADLTELSRIPKPFPALLEFAHNSSMLYSEIRRLQKDLEQSNIVTPSVDELEKIEHRIFTEVDKIKTEAARREKEANSLSLESMSGLEEVLKQRRVVGEVVAGLDEFARGERHLGAHRAIKEARHLLRHIKDIKLIDYIAGANDVFDNAHVQSTSLQEREYVLSHASRRLRGLRGAVERWEGRAEELARLADTVWGAGDAVAALAVRARPRMAAVRDQGLRCRLLIEDIHTHSAKNLSSELQTSLLRAQLLTHQVPALKSELDALAQAAEEKEGILYSLTPAYRKKYLEAVETHVKKLGEKAREYKRLFAGARVVSAAGVRAARAWADVADTVRNASSAARAAAGSAHAAAQLARGPSPMTHTADVTRQASDELRRRGADVLARAEELRSELEHLRRGADLVSVVLRGLGWQERELGGRPRADVAGVLAEADERADRVFATTRALYDEASEVRRRVRYSLRRQLTELQKQGDTALGAAQEHVSQIRGNTVRGAEVAESLAAAAAARAREHRAAGATLAPAVLALRDKVARARHAADSISVSVTSVLGAGAGAGCARAYRVPGASAAVTRVALAVSFDNELRDGPLLYVLDDSQESERYMRLYVEQQRLRLAWRLGAGSGEGQLLHPAPLQPAVDDADHTSYRIEIERVWSTVNLRVSVSGGSPVSTSNTTSGHASSLRPSALWLGAPAHAHEAGLPACVHALYYDDVTVGLWNFVSQPEGAKCTGCTQRWYNGGVGGGSGGESLAWFGGGGYAELKRSGLRPSDRRQFSLAFTFRTRDEHALLFMAVDAVNNRSVSVLMRECRVVFLVEYGGGARLEITAGGAHCGGRPAHVTAIRVFADNKLERGSLRVNGEETLGSPSPPVQSAAALPDLSAASYWVGGPPPGHGSPAPPLLGCLGALTVDREGYDLLDTPTRHGVESRCGARSLRSAILEGSGYIELSSPLLRRKAALGLSFRARAPHGLLLFRAPSARRDNEVDDEDDGDDKHYLVLLMVAGDLEVVAAAGKDELRLRTNGTRYDDGRLHTVRIVRAHKQLELWVNDARVASGSLLGNAYPSRSGGLYVGGVDEWDSSRAPRVPLDGFTGTLADVIVDNTLVGLESAVRARGARLGRVDGEPRDEPSDEPRALQAQPDSAHGCTKSSSYSVEAGAVKFGDAPWSHATLKSPARAKELAVTMQFRTFAPDGLLLLSPGSKAKPKHYLALLVREGKLKLVARGRKRREISLAVFVADGTWRSVWVRVTRGRLHLGTGNTATSTHAPPSARAQRLYVGGMPAPTTLPHIPNSIIRAGGFRGCVRRVSVNGRAEDLVRDARAHHRVGQCFPSVEQGAYFGGDGFATWSSAWGDAEPATELRLQFRTAAPSGVLLATTRLALELRDGAVVLSRRSAGGAETARAASRGSGGRALCDDAWHAVVARVTRGAITLSLDAGPELRGQGTAALLQDAADDPDATHPLYVGGIPEGVLDSADGRENFKGCIRDVSVGGQQRDWGSMEALHNVLLDSCPTAQ